MVNNKDYDSNVHYTVRKPGRDKHWKYHTLLPDHSWFGNNGQWQSSGQYMFLFFFNFQKTEN